MSVMGGPGLTSAQVAARLHPGYPAASGAWMTNSRAAGVPFAADILFLYWQPLFRPLTVTLLRTRTNTGGAGSAVKYAVWANDPETGRPKNSPLMGQNTGLSTATSGTWQDTVIASAPLTEASGFWVGTKFTGTMPVMECTDWTVGYPPSFPLGSAPTVASRCYNVPSAYALDIMATDLTGASLAAYSNVVSALYMEWA